MAQRSASAFVARSARAHLRNHSRVRVAARDAQCSHAVQQAERRKRKGRPLRRCFRAACAQRTVQHAPVQRAAQDAAGCPGGYRDWQLRWVGSHSRRCSRCVRARAWFAPPLCRCRMSPFVDPLPLHCGCRIGCSGGCGTAPRRRTNAAPRRKERENASGGARNVDGVAIAPGGASSDGAGGRAGGRAALEENTQLRRFVGPRDDAAIEQHRNRVCASRVDAHCG